MRVVAAIVAAFALAPSVTQADDWRPHVKSAKRYAQQRSGLVTFDVRTSQGTWGFRRAHRTRTASTVKTLLALAYLRRPSTRRRALTANDRALLDPMIRSSDNDAATQVRNIVGYPRLRGVARRAGLRDFATAPTWGSCITSARDLARQFWRIRRLAPRRHRRYLMSLHRTIVPSQRWGIARARPDGWRLYFKGGWGSGTGAVDHQGALLTRGRRSVALAITTTANPSHEYGQQTLEGVARRLLRGL